MSITYHERPGVYSDYDASSVTATGTGAKVVGLIGTSEAAAGLYTVTDYRDGAAVFGEDSQLGTMLKLAYENGAATVLACPVAADAKTNYEAALALLFAEKQARLLAIGSADQTVQAAALAAAEAASAQKGECIVLAGMNSPTAEGLIERAKALNSERMVLVGPDVYRSGEEAAAGGCMAAAALAGVLAAQNDPALPLNGQVLSGLSGVTLAVDDNQLDNLIRGGVTMLETVGGKVTVIRGVTTRSTTGGSADATWRELTTILIVDDVIPAIRESLRAKFARAKNNVSTRSAIRSQVIVELENRVAREILDSYDQVTVKPSAEDATVCVVEFGMAVTHGLNRIYLTAHITV